MQPNRRKVNLSLSSLSLGELNRVLAVIAETLSQLDAVAQSPDFKGQRLLNVGVPQATTDAARFSSVVDRTSWGLSADRPDAGAGVWTFYIETDTSKVYLDLGVSWRLVAVLKLADLSEKFHASLSNVTSDQHHAKSHIHDGADGSGTVAYLALTSRPSLTPLTMTVSNPPTQAEVQAIANKVDAIIGAL